MTPPVGAFIPLRRLPTNNGSETVTLNLPDALHHDLLQQPVLQADETSLAILDPGKGKIQRGYLWAYVSAQSADRAVVLHGCQPGRSGQYARDVFKGWHGALVVDGYSGYQTLFEKDKKGKEPTVLEAGCMAHTRRKFFDPFKTNKNPVAKRALEIIRERYKLERKIKHRPATEKRQWRKRYAQPQMTAFPYPAGVAAVQSAPGSGLRKALDYTLKRWPVLLRYLDDGRVPIDNNRAENVMCPIAVGRKAWIFAGPLRDGSGWQLSLACWKPPNSTVMTLTSNVSVIYPTTLRRR
ncbi:IS66 family transposase [Martelella alba]|uniref:IS66 family transposase n=1 Tax=Martelella alba TaxID=2590451 RepID=A0ABY2SFH2_9HYPH|nr:IS66 family transposase [Martelella alba]TKI02520.1 IS66 family transposase [Martelella alba]